MFSLSKYFGAKPYSPSKGSSFCSLPRYAAHTSAIITTGNSSPLLACMVIIFMLSVEAAEGAEISKPSFNRARNAETPSPAPSAASLLTFLSFAPPSAEYTASNPVPSIILSIISAAVRISDSARSLSMRA